MSGRGKHLPPGIVDGRAVLAPAGGPGLSELAFIRDTSHASPDAGGRGFACGTLYQRYRPAHACAAIVRRLRLTDALSRIAGVVIAAYVRDITYNARDGAIRIGYGSRIGGAERETNRDGSIADGRACMIGCLSYLQ